MLRLKYVTVFSVVACMLAISVCALAVTNPIPDTGQTQSYTDTFGEDSDYTINPQSYTKLDAAGNELLDSAPSWCMVKDNVTGLIWEVKTDDGSIHDKGNQYNWDKAQSVFITELNTENLGGFSDWRLPTVKELSYIVNSGTHNPAINTAYFPNTMSSGYWSSTTYAGGTGSAWGVGFEVGVGGDYGKSLSFFVRAVRGGQSGSLGDLVINGDGTVTDTSTGLMWQQQTAGVGNMTWEEAISYCESLSLGGYDDWRLPNRNELQSIVDCTRIYPAIDTVAFPNTSDCWSSTTNTNENGNAWCVYFVIGLVNTNIKSNPYLQTLHVRAVRGPNHPPDCSQAQASSDCLWPSNYQMVPVSILDVTDPDGDPVTITITSITSDEPTASDKGPGGSKHAPDASGVGTGTAMIRSERSGNGDGRVYVINFTANDGQGGECTGSVMVKVPHDQSSEACTAIDSGQNYDATEIN
jgi:hypothetical protein